MLQLNRYSFSLLFALATNILSAQVSGSGNAYSGSANGYISINNSTAFSNYPFTITAWIKVANTSTHQTIYYSEDRPNQGYHGFRLQIGSNLNLLASAGSGGCFTNSCQRYWGAFLPSTVANKWIHVAAVFKNATSTDLYLNGILLPSTMVGTGNPTIASLPNPTAIIGMQSQNGQPLSFFRGQLDEITIWNEALTEAKIRTFMCRSVPPNTPGLVSYYKFDENSGNTIIDSGPAQKNGTIKNTVGSVVSGAYIGDSSAYFYPISQSTTMTHYTRSQDTINVSDFSGISTGLQVYSVSTPPNHSNGISFPCEATKYFGIYSSSSYSGVAENVLITYKSKELTSENIFSRPQNDSPSWGNLSGSNTQFGLEWNGLPPMEYVVCLDEEEPPVPVFDSILKVPNVFSPNGDGNNDFFKIESSFEIMHIEIYNRWGNLVYTSSNYTKDFWDGRIKGNDAAEGVYFFILNYSRDTSNHKTNTYSGNLTLVR